MSERFDSVLNFCKKAILIVLPMLILFLMLKQFFIISFLIILSLTLSYCLGIWHIRGLGIELVLLVTVITGFSYGSIMALIVGLVLITFHMIVSQHAGVYLLWVIPGYSIAGFFSGTTTLGIAYFGFIATLILNAVNFLITVIVCRENLGKFLPFSITNIFFNSLLFLYIAPHVMNFVTFS